MKKCLTFLTVTSVSLLGVAGSAYASKVISAFDVTSNSLGTLSFSGVDPAVLGIYEDNMINRSGLSSTYTSGVTDWASYFSGGGPMHEKNFFQNEWFGAQQLPANGNTPLSIQGDIVFDLGSIYKIDGLALWNEDSFGIGKFDVYTSTDGTTWGAAILSNLVPTNWTYDTPYKANTYSWAALDAQFIRLSITEAGYKELTQQYGVAIGEIAFSGTQPVPEPGTLVLLGLGVVGIVGRHMRAKKQ